MAESLIVAEIHAAALRANVRAIRNSLPADTRVCAAVKADAYGHGLACVLPVLAEEGVERVAVANLDEGLRVRRLGWTRAILCFGSVLGAESSSDQERFAQLLLGGGLTCTVTTLPEAETLSALAQRSGRRVHAEIKVDTGMGRFGVLVEEAADSIVGIAAVPGMTVDGVYTHLAAADETDLTSAREQIGRLVGLRAQLQRRGVTIRNYHAANSAAIFRLPEAHLDSVRPGLAVYGYWAGPAGTRPAGLRPAMRIVGRLMAVRRLPAGHAVGYGATFRTARESRVGIVPIGYADGYRRGFSNRAVMSLEPARGQPSRTVPVIGRVSMDQTMLDLTDAGDVRAGDRVVIIDSDPAADNSVEALAMKIGAIPYELTCGIGARVQRLLI